VGMNVLSLSSTITTINHHHHLHLQQPTSILFVAFAFVCLLFYLFLHSHPRGPRRDSSAHVESRWDPTWECQDSTLLCPTSASRPFTPFTHLSAS